MLDKALQILQVYPLCDSCLGRLFAQLGYGIENRERGAAIKTVLHMQLVSGYKSGVDTLDDLKKLAKSHGPTRKFLAKLGVVVEKETCYICGEILEDVEKYAEAVAKALEGLEYESFLVGTVVPRQVLEREAEIVKKFMLTTGESIKHEINRRVGREALRLLGKKVDKHRPQVVVNVNVATGDVAVTRNPLLVEGLYLKLSRQMSQVKKFGNVKTSLFERLQYIREVFGGVDYVIHAAGREDVDVRMLGSGRPVVIEVKQPTRYKAAVPPLVGKDLVFIPKKPTDRAEVRRLKEKAKVSIKLYRALVASDRAVDDLSILSTLQGRAVTQFTPRRIKRRNPKSRRTRMVYEVAWRQITPHVFELYIRCQGGLYVKEFIHGDGGRTTPSVAEVLNTYLDVLELDVLAVE
ncbi:MAG: tRNA pseudouridine(54/55) synthase Pus10 [Pyrobaculum sp.]